ncbi:hypothetical protein PPIS_a3909 [Pseudoalteromonas piscicida]|uniref:Uncharacterized protein n=1 Tax=Pseudoalteromonas piscicida TaxID=43662 RepID=A0ABM6NIS9_PSEO7|nr:hypothetical protein PPIS_a3909 [Pseudoalteromonas piscicida]
MLWQYFTFNKKPVATASDGCKQIRKNLHGNTEQLSLAIEYQDLTGLTIYKGVIHVFLSQYLSVED